MSIRVKLVLIVLSILLLMTFLTGCIPGDGKNTENNKAGFFWGVWHGWVAPVSLIIGIFRDNISIYEENNVGWFYDFGYYIAVISGFGGIALSRKKKVTRVERVERYD